jgi:hypothetical protein
MDFKSNWFKYRKTKFNTGGSGTQTAALAFGGQSPPSAQTEKLWNGSSWSTLCNT